MLHYFGDNDYIRLDVAAENRNIKGKKSDKAATQVYRLKYNFEPKFVIRLKVN